MEDTVENGKLCYQICGKYLTEITNTHLKPHNISLEDYKKKYGIVSLKKGKTWADRFGLGRSIRIKEKARNAKNSKYKLFSKESLTKLYWSQRKSVSKIAEEFNVSPSVVFYSMRMFNVPRRDASESISGSLNGMFGKKHRADSIESIRRIKIGRPNPYAKGNKHYLGRQHTTEWKKNMSKKTEQLWKNKEFREKHTGENHPCWMGGISPYPSIFRIIRKSILERDEHTCQLCSSNNDLCPHHIDYDTRNNRSRNLITLCIKCNVKVNFNREYWKQYFSNIMENRGDINECRTGCQIGLVEFPTDHSTRGIR